MGPISEKKFQANVVELAKMTGWYVYHNPDSRWSEPGFPDLVLIRDRVMFRELKTDKGRVSPVQLEVIGRLMKAGADVEVWRPADMDRIQEQLNRRQ